MEIKEVKNRRDLNKFILLPWKIYRHDRFWVPPLISEVKNIIDTRKNPFWKHAEQKLFIAKKGRKVVGRIAGIIDQNHISYQKEKVGFFGFFESIDDYEVAELLLSTVREFLREKGMERMRGPMNPSINEECATLIDGFNSSPYVMMTHNPPYYPKLFERYGFVKAVDWYAYLGPIRAEPPKEIEIAARFALAKCPGLKIRNIRLEKLDQEAREIRDIFNSAWSKNWGFVPFTDEEMKVITKRLKTIASPELVFIAEVEGKPIGILAGIPNFNQVLKHLNGRLFPFGFLKALYYSHRIDSGRLLIMGVKEEYRKMGIEAVMYLQAFKKAYELGFRWVESSMILEQNIMTRRAAELTGGKIYKTYRIFEIRI